MFASALCGATSNGSVICFHLLQHIIARKQVSSDADAVWQPKTFSFQTLHPCLHVEAPGVGIHEQKLFVKHTTVGA